MISAQQLDALDPQTRLHADLVVLGFEGSYTRVAAFARAWTARRQEIEQTIGRGTFVPLSYANRPVSLRIYAHRLVVAAEGQIVCEHLRIIDRRHDTAGQTVYD